VNRELVRSEGPARSSYHPAMLHEEQIRALRAMTPAERLRIGIDLTDLAWRFLLTLPPEEAQRRLDLEREPWNSPPEREPEEC